MTYESLMKAIERLIIKRQKTDHTDIKELDRINEKLTKLYEIQYVMLRQRSENATDDN